MPKIVPGDGKEPGSAGEVVLPPAKVKPGVSLIVRRVHMFLGLFLAPWMTMYALSTLVMHHREIVRSFYPNKTPALVSERELDYSRAFPTNTTPQQMGQQILSDLGLEGTHSVSGGNNGKPLKIERQHPLGPRRITFQPGSARVSVQRESYPLHTFLERMHTRRGYQHPYALEDTWAFSVDLAAITMDFWSLSGIWLWWELRSTRLWGGLCLGLGVTLFIGFLILM